jgi:TolB-like protein/Tfp pilus assembly protein PilF
MIVISGVLTPIPDGATLSAVERSGIKPTTYRFGPFEADLRTRELRRCGLRMKVRDKSFEALAALLEHSGHVVSRDELRRRLWPESVFVDFDASLNSTINRLRSVLGDCKANSRFIETRPRRGYCFVAPVAPVRPAFPTLAVLPFANLNRDPEQDFFADGVADVLITALGSVSTLRVISRQSVLHLKGTQRTIPDIARELSADAIVEGSVLQAGDQVRITAQLIQTAPERHLWARSYECELGDILTIQGEVSRAITEAVRVALTPAEQGRLSRARPVDAEAHMAYLRGRHHMGQWSRESFEKALACFQAAAQKDPTHALAWAHMADCYGMLGNWGHRASLEAFQNAKNAALEALALDDGLSTAHWAYAWATWICDWDLPTCEAEIQRAIELNPSDEHAHVTYSVFLVTTTTDRLRAVEEMRLALDLCPLSPYVNALMAWTYMLVRDHDRACEQARKTLDLFPDLLLAWWGLGLAELGRSNHDAAIAAFQKAAAISDEPLSLAYLGAAHARAGHRDRAESLLAQLLFRSGSEPVPPRCFAILCTALQDHDEALRWLEQACEVRDSGLFWLRVMPLYDPLHSDPRFQQILRRIGLAPTNGSFPLPPLPLPRLPRTPR